MNHLYIFISAYFASILASIAGIGGGGILIPLFILTGDVDTKDAIILSIMTIAGNSFIRMLYYINKKHKNNKSRFLVDFNIARLIVLFDGNASYLGFILNDILPNIVITGSIIIILGILVYKTVSKAIKYLRQKEVLDTIFITIDNIEYELPTTTSKVDLTAENRIGETNKDLIDNMIYIFYNFCTIAFLTIIRKSNDYPWIIYGVQVLLTGLLCHMTIKHISRIYENRRIQKFDFIEGDIIWNNENFIKYGLVGTIVGAISTLLGIGGGMVMNPVMINLKIIPEVVVATTSITSFFSAVISATQFIIAKSKFEWYYGVLFGVGAAGALTGLIILRFFRKKIKFTITCILAITMIISTIMLIVVNVIELVD